MGCALRSHALFVLSRLELTGTLVSWGDQRKQDKIINIGIGEKPLFEAGWPPRYYYCGILSLVLEVGERSQPLCKLLREGEICWIEHKLIDPAFDTYVIDHRYTVAHHGHFESVRAKIDGHRRKRKLKLTPQQVLN